MSVAPHVIPLRVLASVFAALVALLILTLAVAFVHWGAFNPLIAMAIAAAKATLIVLYFMEVRYSSRLTMVMVCGSLVWLALLLVITMSDYVSRHLVGMGQPW